MHILMVLTSHSRLGATGEATGVWLEEFAAPYYLFIDHGAAVTIASPQGGPPPVDPKSKEPAAQTDATERFRGDRRAQAAFAASVRLAEIQPSSFDAVFFPGGHGPMWDLAEDKASIALIEALHAAGKPVAAVCHGPAVLRHAMAGGLPLVHGKRVTGFSNTEEAAVGLTDVVPFLLQDELVRLGGRYEKGADWGSFVVTDGTVVTGQNPASSLATARALFALLQPHRAAA